MQAPHRACSFRNRVIVLQKLQLDPSLCEDICILGFGEKTSLVSEATRRNQLDALQGCIFNLHFSSNFILFHPCV